jgi:hypothetical protein
MTGIPFGTYIVLIVLLFFATTAITAVLTFYAFKRKNRKPK